MRYVILDNIRSAHNVGSIFRTCDGAGVDKIFLCGYTPTPIDRFGRPVAEISKTSLGASQIIPWEHYPAIDLVVAALKQEGVHIVAIEQCDQAGSLFETIFLPHTAFIFGNEVTGVQSGVLALADMVVQVPMLGQKESLNVSVCTGVVIYEHVRQSRVN